MIKDFQVIIYAYGYRTKFNIKCEDSAEAIEQSIVDKLGEKSIKWEYLGEMNDPKVKRITYEEVIDGEHDATSGRPLREEKRSGSRMGAGAS